MKTLKVYRVFGTRGKDDVVIPAFELAARDFNEATKMAESIEWDAHPVTGIRQQGEIIVP